MRTTIFAARDGRVALDVAERPGWEPLGEYDGKPLVQVQIAELTEVRHAVRHAEMQLVEIAAGGGFAMHSSPDVAYCQIVRGRGRLGLPDGREIAYQAPELYVFLPGSLHDWRAVEEDTLLSVCLIKQD
jgi:quercetin dioxygenase-like cupin family protein